MRLVENIYFIKQGSIVSSKVFTEAIEEIKQAIQLVTWQSKEIFVINPVRKGNGVFPIKKEFVSYLTKKGWIPEYRMSLAKGMNPGPIDALKHTSVGDIAIEWETGNISSSHRALNKIAVGILQKKLIGGFLVIPDRQFSQYLTDRIGNYEELKPYFPLYQNLRFESGFMGVFVVEHDFTSSEVPLIPKGRDGYSKKQSSKKAKGSNELPLS